MPCPVSQLREVCSRLVRFTNDNLNLFFVRCVGRQRLPVTVNAFRLICSTSLSL